jgi:hypothetical protein
LINLKSGEFKLDEYDLVIHPDLTLSAFKVSGIPFKELLSNEKGEASFEFKGSLKTLKALFQIEFTQEVLFRFRIYFDQKYKLGPGKRIEDWLTKTTGESPPFEYEWGCLITELDARSDNDFSALTKYSILNLGRNIYPRYFEVKSFYELRHSEEKLQRQIYGG